MPAATTAEHVILVDDADRECGSGEKLAVHRAGQLHRAFSIVIVNGRGEWLLQRRAPTKYHSAGLWSNACCGHPRPGEETLAAAARRLREELALPCPLEPAFTFRYEAAVGGGLTEHEIDHVFVGSTDDLPTPNADEVDAWRWVTPAALRDDVHRHPDRYTPWFRLLVPQMIQRGLV